MKIRIVAWKTGTLEGTGYVNGQMLTGTEATAVRIAGEIFRAGRDVLLRRSRTGILVVQCYPKDVAEEKWPRCPDCGGDVVLTARAGRTREIERGVVVEIPSDVKIPTCTKCGEESMTLDISEPLDALLRETIRRRSDAAPDPSDLPSKGD